MATIYADSASQAHVQAAIDEASDLDTVIVPAGTPTWTTDIDIPSEKSILLQGNGIGSTIISMSSFGTAIYCANNSSRITGFELNECAIIMEGRGWRIDHCEVSTSSFVDGISIRPPYSVGSLHPTGVIDNCVLGQCRILVMGGWYDDMSWGNDRWYEELGLGTSNFVFIEDNVHNLGGIANAVDANVGGRYVFRHNEVNEGWIEAHSIQGTHRATRCWEIYSNTLTRTSGSPWYPPFRIRGGTGVIYDNTIVGSSWPVYGIMLDNIRSCNDLGAGGLADGSSPWDGNTAPTGTYQGWPARDQIGRSTDESLWVYGGSIPAQTGSPAYFWDNYYGATNIDGVLYEDCGRQAIHIVEGRDYHDRTEMPGYTPYTYPHPLRGEGSVAVSFKQSMRMRF